MKCYRNNRRGYIYLIRSKRAVKIGITHFPLSRFDDISEVELDRPIQLLACVCVLNPRLTETTLHKRYAAARIHGEWFVLEEDQILDLIEIFYKLNSEQNLDRVLMPYTSPTH